MNAREKTNLMSPNRNDTSERNKLCTAEMCKRIHFMCNLVSQEFVVSFSHLMAPNPKIHCSKFVCNIFEIKKNVLPVFTQRFTAAMCIGCTDTKNRILKSFSMNPFFVSFNLMRVFLVLFLFGCLHKRKPIFKRLQTKLKRKSTLMSALRCIINICRMKSQVRIFLV